MPTLKYKLGVDKAALIVKMTVLEISLGPIIGVSRKPPRPPQPPRPTTLDPRPST